jgi:hypothetical protein
MSTPRSHKVTQFSAPTGLAGAQVNDVARDGNRNDAVLAGVGADG